MPTSTKRKGLARVGMAALFISILLWLAVLAVPFLEISDKWLLASGLYGLSYVFWFAAIGILGTATVKKTWEKVRALIRPKTNSNKGEHDT